MTSTVALSMLTLPVTSTTPSTFKVVWSAAVKDDKVMSAPKSWVAPMPLATKCAVAIWGKAFEDKKWPSKVNVMPFKSINVPEGETSTELASASVTNDTSWFTTTLSSPPGTQSQDHVTGSLQMPRWTDSIVLRFPRFANSMTWLVSGAMSSETIASAALASQASTADAMMCGGVWVKGSSTWPHKVVAARKNRGVRIALMAKI